MVTAVASSRVDLYRTLADPGRLRVLALCAQDALTVSELATVLNEKQPGVSKRARALRSLNLLDARKEGTRTFLRANPSSDPVVDDALHEGRRLCQKLGQLARAKEVVLAREQQSVIFFDEVASEPPPSRPRLLPLVALAPMIGRRSLCVDVGTGVGHTLDVVAPLFQRVIAIDRSRSQLAQAAALVQERGYANVQLSALEHSDVALIETVDRLGGADLVFASRVLHHAAQPARAMASFARLLRPGGHLALVDYAAHHDERMREQQADVWLGFSTDALARFSEEAGLRVLDQAPVSPVWVPEGPDRHLPWQRLWAQKAAAPPRG